ncbi:retrotransposon protein, putative, ty1-copia subclass [Tanacetum coccineum]
MFKKEKLSGNDWFARLKLVLRVEKKMYVIEQRLPPAPEPVAEPNIVAQWTALYDAHTEIACLMLRSMTPGLHRQFELHYPYDMIQELRSMFEKQAGVEKFDLIQSFMLANQERLKTPKPTAIERHTKDDACHHCKEVGHWKRNCPVYLAELLKKKKQVGSASSSVRAQVEAIGSFDLVLPNGLVICLDNCYYAPTITRGVVSVSHLVDNRFVQCFTDYGISVSKNDVLYLNVIARNGIYEIDMHDLVPNVNSIYNVSNKRVKRNLDSTYLWHCRLAHINKKRIKQLQQDGLLKSTDDESFDKCESCLSGKMTKKPFPHSNERAKDPLEFRYGYVYLLKHKHEVFETFKVFKNEVENQLGKTIKAIRSDRGGEYISQEFKDYLKANGIVQ